MSYFFYLRLHVGERDVAKVDEGSSEISNVAIQVYVLPTIFCQCRGRGYDYAIFVENTYTLVIKSGIFKQPSSIFFVIFLVYKKNS